MNQKKEFYFVLTQSEGLAASPLGSLSGDTTIEIQADGGWTITGCYRNQVLFAVSLCKQNDHLKE